MSNAGIRVDASELYDMFKDLTGKEMKGVASSALRKSANILARQTTKNFQSKINISSKRKVKVKRKKGGEAERWKRIATVKVNAKRLYAVVHIMSDFRAKFFEMGTRIRHTKGIKVTGSYYKGKRKYLNRKGKGRNTGRIKAGWFFKKAQAETERKVFSVIDENISKAIKRIQNKKR